jgi:CRP/FNR family transcriptional regulator
MTMTKPLAQHDAGSSHRGAPPCFDGGLHVNCQHCRTRFLSVCSALDDEELHALAEIVDPRCIAAKTTLFSQGEEANSVFNVTEGMARLYKLLPDGRRQIIGFALPGDFLGLSLSDRFSFSADAVDDMRVCRISRTKFSQQLDEKPHLMKRLHEMAANELMIAQDQLVVLGRRSAEERLAVFLLGLRKRFARIHHLSPTVPLPMSRQDIADYLGLTIETVSRTFSKMFKEKTLLNVPDGVRILELDRLTALGQR